MTGGRGNEKTTEETGRFHKERRRTRNMQDKKNRRCRERGFIEEQVSSTKPPKGEAKKGQSRREQKSTAGKCRVKAEAQTGRQFNDNTDHDKRDVRRHEGDKERTKTRKLEKKWTHMTRKMPRDESRGTP